MKEIQGIIGSYFKNLYSTKLENLKETIFLINKYHLPELNQDQINALNRPVTPKEIEAIIKSFPNKKGTGSDIFSTKFYQTIKEKLIPILLKLFHTIGRERAL